VVRRPAHGPACPSFDQHSKGARRGWFALSERNSPGSIIVNTSGKRFMNESMPYVEAAVTCKAACMGRAPAR
jgi:hypothetical protein